MCLIAFAYKIHPVYDLVLIANRDEFYARPTREAMFWSEEGFPDLLAGKDMEAGGTWMGITQTGKWAAVTNYRDISNIKENAPSRGNLVLDYLKGNNSAQNYLENIHNKADSYNGFNLLIGEEENVYYYSNQTHKITVVQPGIYSLSNALLNTHWPKSDTAKKNLQTCIANNTLDKTSLFAILTDFEKAPEKKLPHTGLPAEMEKELSSIFIKTQNYGTRSSTLLLKEKSGKASFIERLYNNGLVTDFKEKAFRI